MKKFIIWFVLPLIFINVKITGQTVKIEKMPSNMDDFVKLRDKIASTPEGGATIFLLSLKIFADNPELGKQCLVVASDRASLREGDVYKGFSLLHQDMQLITNQINKNKSIPDSYIKGSNLNDGYKVKLPYVYEFSSNAYSGNPDEGRFKLFVKCSGADSPRPVTLIRNDKGIWKATAWSSLVLDIKKPPVSDDL